MLFGTQIRYLKFFNWFFYYDIFVWILLCLSFLALVWLFLCPHDVAKDIDNELDQIAAGDAEGVGAQRV